jgi:predicted enzyme related to lactoylglutathione lyase
MTATRREREGDLWVATVRDPAGNLIGLWQEGPR